jgi:hypothetical protein
MYLNAYELGTSCTMRRNDTNVNASDALNLIGMKFHSFANILIPYVLLTDSGMASLSSMSRMNVRATYVRMIQSIQNIHNTYYNLSCMNGHVLVT